MYDCLLTPGVVWVNESRRACCVPAHDVYAFVARYVYVLFNSLRNLDQVADLTHLRSPRATRV